jgi:hypothetical protein
MVAFRFRVVLATVLGLTSFASPPAAGSAPAGRYTITSTTVRDTRTGLTWQRAVSPSATWADASAYCAGLSAALGGTGWRLPDVKELLTLVDDAQATGPTIDVNAFPATPAAFFWSSTPMAGMPSLALGVQFASGSSGNARVSDPFPARCVH